MPARKRPLVTKPEPEPVPPADPEATSQPESETTPTASAAAAGADHATLVTTVEEPASTSVAPEETGEPAPAAEKSADIGQTVSEWARAPQRSEEKEKPRLGVVWAWAIIAFVVGAIVGGVGIYFFGGLRPLSAQVQASPSPIPTPTPTPAARPVRSEVKLQVLNASGVSGAAAAAKDYLEGLGYKDVAVGNSDEEDVVGIRVNVKADKSQYLSLLEKDLQSKYDQPVVSGGLEVSSDYDVVILLGKVE